jgi:trans-2,3-dihydro-3-hydroxyanthranilate isomerase
LHRRYVTVDVFTDRAFGGNPLAVVLDASGLSPAQMQAITNEFNYSETTFVLPPKQPEHTAWVRIFTPTSEIPFAGHPNVGTAFVLAREALRRGEVCPEGYLFEEEAGLVPVPLLHQDGTLCGAELQAPQPLSRGAKAAPDAAAACLSLRVDELRLDRHDPLVLSVGYPFLVVELASRDALRRAFPLRAAYDAILPLNGARAVYAYTRDTKGQSPGLPCDFEARMFSPRMTEDPATGSATAAVAAHLADRMSSDGEIRFRFRQGTDMGRPSLLEARVLKTPDAATVHVGGRCVEVMSGMIDVPDAGG